MINLTHDDAQEFSRVNRQAPKLLFEVFVDQARLN